MFPIKETKSISVLERWHEDPETVMESVLDAGTLGMCIYHVGGLCSKVSVLRCGYFGVSRCW
jgi:hypothetical protein